MDEITDFYIIFYVNKKGLNDFTVIKAVSLKDAVVASSLLLKLLNVKF